MSRDTPKTRVQVDSEDLCRIIARGAVLLGYSVGCPSSFGMSLVPYPLPPKLALTKVTARQETPSCPREGS